MNFKAFLVCLAVFRIVGASFSVYQYYDPATMEDYYGISSECMAAVWVVQIKYSSFRSNTDQNLEIWHSIATSRMPIELQMELMWTVSFLTRPEFYPNNHLWFFRLVSRQHHHSVYRRMCYFHDQLVECSRGAMWIRRHDIWGGDRWSEDCAFDLYRRFWYGLFARQVLKTRPPACHISTNWANSDSNWCFFESQSWQGSDYIRWNEGLR